MTKIDNIDRRGDIREHDTRDGVKAVCGVVFGMTQTASGNRPCLRCEKIAARCQIQPARAVFGTNP